MALPPTVAFGPRRAIYTVRNKKVNKKNAGLVYRRFLRLPGRAVRALPPALQKTGLTFLLRTV
jgi:hypothetical protein